MRFCKQQSHFIERCFLQRVWLHIANVRHVMRICYNELDEKGARIRFRRFMMLSEQFLVELHEVCNVPGAGTWLLKHVLICGSG